jgi:hypothetical protein
MTFLLRFSVLAILAAAPLHAIPDQMAISTDGSGVVEIGSFDDRVSKANLVLKPDGRFTLGLVGQNDTHFTGTWRKSDRDIVSFRLTSADGRDARGGGEVEFRGYRDIYEIGRVTLSGENDKGRPLNARFSGAVPVVKPIPVVPPRLVLDSERSGFGRLQVGGRDQYRIARAHVQLLADGSAHVHTEGSAPLRYEGTWVSGGDGIATLNVRGGLDGERLRGIARYRYGRLSHLELSGTRNSRYYAVEFEPSRR